MTYKRQKAVLFTFLIAAISFHGSGCSQESKKESAKEEAETVQVEGTYKYKLLDDLGNANIITKNVNDVGKRKLTINGEERTVLFEHPNSEVAFRDIVINKNTQLKFGIGIEERAWDKRGDGVFFEGPESAVRKAQSFWDDNFMKEELKKAMFDWLLYGDGYLWIGRLNRKELDGARSKALAQVPSEFRHHVSFKKHGDEDEINFVRHSSATTMNI
ncbi:hypothetical protein IID10_18700, partial [candidate division KSB1 bacterium]|nr:hypothetical protein [candidate division KSB1 bacterium]